MRFLRENVAKNMSHHGQYDYSFFFLLVYRLVTKRMNNEFAEMLQTTTGRLLDQITVSSI